MDLDGAKERIKELEAEVEQARAVEESWRVQYEEALAGKKKRRLSRKQSA